MTDTNHDSIDLVEKFDALQTVLETNSALTVALFGQPHDQARISAAIQTLKNLQSAMEKIYDILVDLNNVQAGTK